jgi:hypothetical protein
VELPFPLKIDFARVLSPVQVVSPLPMILSEVIALKEMLDNKLCVSTSHNHGFFEGNKTTAWFSYHLSLLFYAKTQICVTGVG